MEGAEENELYEKLKTYDVIWVNGGDTFYLLYWVKKSGFDKILPRLLEEGKTYVGLSAGSILLCPTIEVAGWEGQDDPNIIELKDHNGLNMIHFFMFVHYNSGWEGVIEKHEKDLSGKLIRLSNEQAVLEDGTVI